MNHINLIIVISVKLNLKYSKNFNLLYLILSFKISWNLIKFILIINDIHFYLNARVKHTRSRPYSDIDSPFPWPAILMAIMATAEMYPHEHRGALHNVQHAASRFIS